MWQSSEKAVGVIVARFQVADLHAGHRYLIEQTRCNFPKTFIVLGEHGGLRTERNPLTFQERELMIRESYPGADLDIDRLRDHPFCHLRWSDWLDELIQKRYPGEKAVMIGSRNSFLGAYTGKHEKRECTAIDEKSGTEQRQNIKYSSGMNARAAIIFHEMNRHATAYSAADIAIVDDEHERVLAITKHWFDGLYSLPGGFVDPEKDSCDEDTARRERGEELLNIVTSDHYEQLGARIRVEDPRYRDSKDKIYTTLFCTSYQGGVPTPGDDAKGARWMSRSELDKLIVPWHKPQIERIKARWNTLRNGQAAA